MLCKNVADMSEASSTHRSKVISEIIETEKTYLNQLEKLQNFFSKSCLERGLLPSHVHSAIFGQLSAIYQMNSRLLEEILIDIENIGCAFLKFGPFLKVYSSYANNFQRSLEILQKWEIENEPFKAFISATETRPEVQTKLSALLITPIQRIPRYKLLLEELLKYSDSNSQTFQDIEGALIKVSEAAKHIDRSVYESQAFNRLLLVQRALKDQQPSLIAPGRKLLKEGILKKVSRKGKGSQTRLFFLFSDMLIYTKLPSQNIGQNPKESFSFSTEFDLKPNSLECCCMLPLRHCRVKTVFGSSEHGITFRLQCSDEDLLLYNATASEGEAWISAIKKASDEASQKRKTLRKASSKRKAIRRTPLKSINFSADESKDDIETNSSENKYPKLFELESLKNRLRSARDCLTPPKPFSTPQKQKKNYSVHTPVIAPKRSSENSVPDCPVNVQTSISNGTLKIQKPSGPHTPKKIQGFSSQKPSKIYISNFISNPLKNQGPDSRKPLKSQGFDSQNPLKSQGFSSQNPLQNQGSDSQNPLKNQGSDSRSTLRTPTSNSHPMNVQSSYQSPTKSSTVNSYPIRKIQSPLRNRARLSRSLKIKSSPHGPTITASFRVPKPLSPLATCSWEDGLSPRSDSKPFVYRSGVRGREGSQLTPTPSLKISLKENKGKKKSPKTSLFSPAQKKQKTSKD